MKYLNDRTFILRFIIAIILFAHSIPGIIDGSIRAFGTAYLDQAGFAPLGLIIAWSIKLSHILCAVLLLANRYVKFASVVTIFILIAGIFMVHLKDGWYVVGGGRNGIEFNLLMIVVLCYIMMEDVRGKKYSP
ncbi:MAG: DoxX family protein [Terrimonas sp.]|nr:DoxX family protein [Terrimonas sp.]OJY79682.1 MAG: DoxX family protein [Sphingobacteriales bacterium 40-81]